MRWIAANFVQLFLTPEQKELWIDTSTDLFQYVETGEDIQDTDKWGIESIAN